MRNLVFVLSLITHLTAWAGTGGIYVGQKLASSENDRGAVCFLKLSDLILSSDASRFHLDAEVSGIHFQLENTKPTSCAELQSNLYPEGPYGGLTKLIVKLSSDCKQIQSFTFTDGMRAGKTLGFTCAQLHPYSSN